MIKIDFYLNGFTCQGHANSAKYNSDIVCAGVSAIVLGALNWFESDTNISVKNNIVKVIGSGIDFENKLKLILVQLKALNHDWYAKYIELNEHNVSLM